MKFQLNRTKSSASKWASKAPKSKGGVMGFVVLTELLVLIPEVIFMLPMLILLYSKVLDKQNEIMGDPTGLPENFNLYLIIAGILTLVFIICIQAWIVLSARYAWKRVKKSEE